MWMILIVALTQGLGRYGNEAPKPVCSRQRIILPTYLARDLRFYNSGALSKQFVRMERRVAGPIVDPNRRHGFLGTAQATNVLRVSMQEGI
jgi:hypothetical protein